MHVFRIEFSRPSVKWACIVGRLLYLLSWFYEVCFMYFWEMYLRRKLCNWDTQNFSVNSWMFGFHIDWNILKSDALWFFTKLPFVDCQLFGVVIQYKYVFVKWNFYTMKKCLSNTLEFDREFYKTGAFLSLIKISVHCSILPYGVVQG